MFQQHARVLSAFLLALSCAQPFLDFSLRLEDVQVSHSQLSLPSEDLLMCSDAHPQALILSLVAALHFLRQLPFFSEPHPVLYCTCPSILVLCLSFCVGTFHQQIQVQISYQVYQKSPCLNSLLCSFSLCVLWPYRQQKVLVAADFLMKEFCVQHSQEHCQTFLYFLASEMRDDAVLLSHQSLTNPLFFKLMQKYFRLHYCSGVALASGAVSTFRF